MSRESFAAGPLAIQAELVDDLSVVPLGVAVVFHPGISKSMHSLTLEAVLRHWQREIGTVTRGGQPQSGWLPGWTLKAFQKGTVVGLRIAYRHGEEEKEEEAQ